jgi:signal transduction histidine kinase
MQNNELNNLKQRLISLLEQPDTNYDEVIALSNQIVQLDPTQVRFSVDAGHISRLGRELVGRKETAVAELVKNSYDADANFVELTFIDAEERGGTLLIEDDGSGMDVRQLINGFMRLSSTQKIDQPYSIKYNRVRAGRKGIGRFATQRLGKALTIITYTEDMENALQVKIDWEKFQNNVDLNAISSQIEYIEKPDGYRSGTTLIIENLVDAWSDTEIQRVFRYNSDLLQPYPLSPVSLKRKDKDVGFIAKMYREVHGRLQEVASIDKLVYEHALAVIDAFVDAEGRAVWSIESKQLDIYESALSLNLTEQKYKELKNVYLRAHYYIYNGPAGSFLPKNFNKFIKDMAKERSGIRVYRNGFRVPPYGEIGDDWLALDHISSVRSLLPPIKNNNFFGIVEINDIKEGSFEETSSREGLIENQAFLELVNFCNATIQAAVRRVGEARGKKITPSQKGWEKKDSTSKMREVAIALSELALTVESTALKIHSPEFQANELGLEHSDKEVSHQSDEIGVVLRDIANDLQSAADQQEQDTKSLIEENEMLRILSSLGLAIGEFTHEINHYIPSLYADALWLEGQSSLPGNQTLLNVATSLKQNMNTLKSYGQYFLDAVSANASREVEIQEMGRALRSFWHTMKPVAQRYNIVLLEPIVEGYAVFSCPMHPSEWSSILLNLFTNSRKAIQRRKVPGKILLRTGIHNKNVYVEFIDNGDGIPLEYRDRVFNAFFTTSELARPFVSADTDDRALVGSGLGLKLVKDILTSYNGDIWVTDPPSGYATCFRIEIPRATRKEIRDYGY